MQITGKLWRYVCWFGNRNDSNIDSLYLCSKEDHSGYEHWWNERIRGVFMRDDNKVMNIIMIILFFVFLGLIIWAQKTVSVTNLMIEIVGLIGLLTLLFLYNKKHK